MSRFCLHCGKELNDDDLRCPDCGAVTEKGKASGIGHEAPVGGYDEKSKILPVVLIAILLIASAMLVFPLFTNGGTESYNVTVTVESISILDAEKGLYTEDGFAPVTISLGYSTSSSSTGETVYIPSDKPEKLWKCKVDGTVLEPNSDNTITFKMDGNKNNFNFTVFFLDCHKSKDIIDIYSDRGNIVGLDPPTYIGATGVSFDLSDLDDDGRIVLKGDSDPIGTVTMKIDLVKN